MIPRHQQRIWAMQILYSLDLLNELNLKEARKKIRELKRKEDLQGDNYYFEELVTGVLNDLDRYNQLINQQAIDWTIERMAYIDRNILRIALYEIENKIPVGVAINEAVELAKDYGDGKSSSFVNGILAKINLEG